MNLNFRSSLHGFNRQDVANYLEYLNNRHNTELTQLNTELEAMRQLSAERNTDRMKVKEHIR